MKIIKFFAWSIGIIILIIALLLGAFEFLVWQMHDYAPNYAEIQFCIEHGRVWDYETEQCNGQE